MATPCRRQRDGRLAELHYRLQELEQKATQIEDEIARAGRRLIDEDELVGALEAFDPAWDALKPREKERLVRLLVQQVEVDAEHETISVTFHPSGIESLAREEVPA